MAEDDHVTVEAVEPVATAEPTEKENVTVTEKETTTVTATEDKPEPSAATDEKMEIESDADKASPSENVADSKGESTTSAIAEPETNGTPAVKKSNNRRQSTGANKLSRKKSQIRIILDAKPGDYYLARLRSYAPWPAIVCDDEMLPEPIRENRPVTAKQSDGTYRADYADDGKRAHERTFPVMFFGSNEFAWIPNNQLTPLDPADCKDVSEKNKAKSLIAAYKIAAEGNSLKYFKKLLADHEAALQQEIEEQEAEEAEEAKAEEAKAKAKAEKKGKRKSKAAETDVETEDADAKKAKPSRKRKEVETDAETEKPAAKTPKANTKLKLSTPKAPAEEKKTPASKSKRAAPKKKATASDEETVPEPKAQEKQISPEELRKRKEKEVLFLRHKLQKCFISRELPPQEEEMATMATYFEKLEKHADLEVSIIRMTKINKVLKMIVKLNSIPRDEEFNFRQRSINILSSWKSALDLNAPADKVVKPNSNGHKDDETLDTPKVDTEDDKELENKTVDDDTPMPDVDMEAESEKIDEVKPEDKIEDKTEEKAQETIEENVEEKTEEQTEETTENKTDASA